MVDGGEIGVSRDSAVNERLWPLVVGDEVTVSEGDSRWVTVLSIETSE
jgi:hypothetical protein